MSPSLPWPRPPAALLLALPALAQAPDPALAERLFRAGERAQAAGDTKGAVEAWTQALQAAPAGPLAPRVLLGLARHQAEAARNPGAALSLLERLRTEHPGASEAAEGLLLQGVILARQARRPADLTEAQAAFHRLLDIYPDAPCGPEARLHLGRAWRDLGQPGRALAAFVDAFRLKEDPRVAPAAMLGAALALDAQGDTPGALRMLQALRTRWPDAPEAAEGAWRLAVMVKHRLLRPPLRLEGPWPEGRTRWLKTPTLLALGPEGDLLVYQNDLDQAFRWRQGALTPVGPAAPGARALVPRAGGGPWVVTRATLWREGVPTPQVLAPLGSVCGAALDRWGTLWVADARTPALTLLDPGDAAPRSLPFPLPSALAPLGDGGLALASDAEHRLCLLDGEGRIRVSAPYGQGLPAPFRTVTALAADGAGQVAALVDGGAFGEGVVVYGPDGAVLRHATLKDLGVGGRITALALDRAGGVVLCDRRNDLLLRLD